MRKWAARYNQVFWVWSEETKDMLHSVYVSDSMDYLMDLVDLSEIHTVREGYIPIGFVQ